MVFGSFLPTVISVRLLPGMGAAVRETIPHHPPIRFGDYELDTRAGKLCHGETVVELHKQPLRLLLLLLEHPGELVTREELHTSLWPDHTFVDFEDGLNHAIRRLREALGDSAETPRFIETLPRRGYRFIYPVYSAVGAGLPRPIGPGGTKPPPHRQLAIVLGSLVLLLAALAGTLKVAGVRNRWLIFVGARQSASLPKISSLAVLPLENLSHDPEQEYFADGMTEALITNLGQISALRVVSRTSVMQYKRTKKALPEIARELNVDGVVEGTVARSGSRVRITANLLYAPTDRHLWAETYQGDLHDLLALQDQVAQAIANAIRIKLTPQEQARLAHVRAVSPEAHEAYLKARYYWNLRTDEGRKKSIGYFEQAIERDPSYALAYAGLADSYIVLGEAYLTSPEEAFPRAKAAAFKALELDESLGQPHASLGAVKVDYDWDWVGAEKEYQRAIELSPGYATAHQWYAEYLSPMGRHDEAIAEIQRAQELDPLSPVISAVGGSVLLNARQYDKAIVKCRNTLELSAGFWIGHRCLGQAYEQEKLYEQSIAEYEKVSGPATNNPARSPSLARDYLAVGKRAEALKIFSNLRELSKQRYVPSYQAMAEIYIALGDFDQAFAWLEKAYRARYYGLVLSLKVDPGLDPLRSDPRFRDLLRRMNFPP